VIARRRGAVTARRDARLQLLTFIDRIVLKELLRRPSTRERAQLAALRRAAQRREPSGDGSGQLGGEGAAVRNGTSRLADSARREPPCLPPRNSPPSSPLHRVRRAAD
jgi:hypothetical protein